jgi:hypothetical protein
MKGGRKPRWECDEEPASARPSSSEQAEVGECALAFRTQNGRVDVYPGQRLSGRDCRFRVLRQSLPALTQECRFPMKATATAFAQTSAAVVPIVVPT